jgi:two-component system sensor kinase FixL
MTLSGRRYAGLIAGYICAYVALDWISYIYSAAPPLAITPWNPPPGLSLALLLRYGARNGPWLFVAALVAELLVRGPHMPTLVLIAASVLPAAVYTVLAWLLRGPLRFAPDFVTLRDATVFLPAVAGGAGVLAITLVGLFDVAGILPADSFAKSAAQFWIGDLIGIVVVTPLLLVFTRQPRERNRVAPLEAALQLAAVLLALGVVFGSGWFEEAKLFYVLFLPLIWIAMRHGIEGTTIATVVIQVGLIMALRLGGHRAATALEFQFLLLAVAVTGLFLGLTVSERTAIARQLREKQFDLERTLRLASASEMASALAHELNQPLTAIGSYVRACQLMLGEQPRLAAALRDTMGKVVEEVTRAGDVVRKLRDFFRTGSAQLAPMEVGWLLQGAIDAARERSERHRVHWRLECAPSLPVVIVDRIQIETVLHNLISNAIEALKGTASNQRLVTISAAPDEGPFVRVSVADNGPGIAGEVAARLFQPFATSKPQGMGLGLAISRSIIDAHGGRLWVEPTESGCTFSFTLPTAEQRT